MEAKEEMKNKKKLSKTEHTHIEAGLVSTRKRHYTNCSRNNHYRITHPSRNYD